MLFLSITNNLFSQSNDILSDVFVEANYSKGTILHHRSTIAYIVEGYPRSFEINIGKKTDNSKFWHHLYKQPEYGFGYKYCDFKNPNILGNAHSIISFIKIPMVRGKNIRLNYGAAAGFSWLNKSFDPDENYYHLAIGSHSNIILNLNMEIKIKLLKKLDLIQKLGVVHYSNGAVTKPNLGINIFSWHTGFSYNFDKPESKNFKIPQPDIINRNKFELVYSAGLKDISPQVKNRYITMSFCADYFRRPGYKYKFGIGADLFYNRALHKEAEINAIFNEYQVPEYSEFEILQPGLHISYARIFHNTTFLIQLGYYLHTVWKKDGNIYSRFGLRYKFSDRFVANLTLKTHFAKADYPEFGIGYCF